jgi:hypothetical protein
LPHRWFARCSKTGVETKMRGMALIGLHRMIEAKGRGPKDVSGLACGFFVIKDEMLHAACCMDIGWHPVE